MAASQGGSAAIADAGPTEAGSVGDVLRLLSGGAPGEILLALRDGPLQTKVLTHRVKGYTARTIYRYLSKLGELGALERDDEPGGSARVVHTLDAEAGRELAALLDRFASASMTRLPNGQIDSRGWTSLGLLADLWEAGVIAALSGGPTSPTQLTRELRCLSYHQLNRRAARFKESGFFREAPQSRRQRRCYDLTRKARRTMGLVVGIGRWQRHPGNDSAVGLTATEMTTVLRVLLPLAQAPREADNGIGFVVRCSEEEIELRRDAGNDSGARAVGTVEDWTKLLLDGQPVMKMSGNPALLRRTLRSLYDELWEPA
jgi:DNA-binding HxlR family transcriptional regulator